MERGRLYMVVIEENYGTDKKAVLQIGEAEPAAKLIEFLAANPGKKVSVGVDIPVDAFGPFGISNSGAEKKRSFVIMIEEHFGVAGKVVVITADESDLQAKIVEALKISPSQAVRVIVDQDMEAI